MRFSTGVLLGLLLAGPTVEHHYHVTETNRLRIERQVRPSTDWLATRSWQDVEGSEACVIDLLGGPGADWGADEVLEVLDEAWQAGVSPCELDR